MVRGVTAVAQGDQVGRVIHSTAGTGNQMMDVGLAVRAWITARPADVRIANENDAADLAPLLGLRLSRREGHSVQLGNSRLPEWITVE
jgi:hypothetical protein